MTDAKRWIDDIRHAEPPELWETIEQRVARGEPTGPPPRSTRPLLAVGILAISVLVLGSVFYALGRIGERGDRSIGETAADEIVRYRFDGPPQPLVVGDGAAWVKVGAGDGTPHYLARIDAATGDIVRIDVPGGDWPAVGGGSAWLLCNARACDDGAVLQLDPQSGDIVRTVRLPARGNQIAGVADGVWITTETGLTFVNAAGVVVTSFELAGADLLATDGTDLWVAVGNAVVRVDPTTGEQLARVIFGNICTMDAAGGLVWVASCGGGFRAQGTDADALMGADAIGGVLFRVPIEGYGQMRYAGGVLWLAQKDPTDERRLQILRFDPRTGEDLGEPITIARADPVHMLRGVASPHVFFAVGEGSLWLTDFDAGEVIRVGVPSEGFGESPSAEPAADGPGDPPATPYLSEDERWAPDTYREGSSVVMPVTFPNGTTAELVYPADLPRDLAELSVRPSTFAEGPRACGASVEATRYDPSLGWTRGSEPLAAHTRPDGMSVELWQGQRDHAPHDYLVTRVGPWSVLVPCRGNDLTPDDFASWAEGLEPVETPEGLLVIGSSGSIAANPYGDIRGAPSIHLSDRDVIVELRSTRRCADDDGDRDPSDGVVQWCIDPQGGIYLYANSFAPSGKELLASLVEGLDVRAVRPG